MLFTGHLVRRSFLQIRGSFNITASKKITTENNGLLVGATEKFFTSNLNITTAAELVQDSDAVFRRAIAKDLQCSGKDAGQYLSEIEKKASQYLKKDEVCGRREICNKIKNAMLKQGSLMFLTGGRSVGKSKILRSIVKGIGETQDKGEVSNPPQARVSVIMVDGRKYSDLITALNNIATNQIAMKLNAITNTLPSFTFNASAGLAVAFDFKGIDFKKINVAEIVDELALRHPQDIHHTVLILDEANVYLNCTGKDEATKYTRELFNAVVANTKQQMLMSVLLVSSDEGLPFHLEDLNLSPDHITSTLVINEPTPRECRDLLQKEFGVGEHLSSALLDCYGGNVYQMCRFLQLLPSSYEEAESEINVFMGPSRAIGKALGAWEDIGGEETEMLKVLEELARTGFVPMKDTNKLARLLTKCNVCAFLTKAAVEYQVPKELRAKREGLIPASHLMRVLIADRLVELDEKKQRNAVK